MVVKTRKQGNSIMITIPSSLGIKENMEYTPEVSKDGVISFKPAHQNIYENCNPSEIQNERQKLSLNDNFHTVGKENVWD
ncbi:AbrB family transcriptional regulator [Fructilactobacillus lindneri]|uniref:SpoVT-AbrB domain-containing protein n=2 Tax=Fructilactobacillus lindneri TaxID=53444 RepID=A0A0R2JW97_9LACO|nr:hypothetical protein [Fructilactobacillus lindneri]ANZ57738.1 AbrB family transcriptional regulator [Fructilactobacillus lindneri]ANZ59007.1 AbrB family transcriptional regulator [Fructilactobacillus lindneri]KRN78823.1 hypothetical protein IV52_GL001103 [Fructilactobacillus lindneri DSM 20690 = JCM 11027]POG98034.1 AbrB family transcriptional regulator [Fructilactobacillus lindneri]POG99069.1 AbrB family transcriptional regulator [Fructilactobacillus lindneri]